MAAPTTVAATTKVEVAAATGTGNRERRTKVGSVASPTPVEIRPARKAPIPERTICPFMPSMQYWKTSPSAVSIFLLRSGEQSPYEHSDSQTIHGHLYNFGRRPLLSPV